MRPPQVGRCPTCYWGRAEDNYSAIRRQLLSHKKETMLSATTGMQRENIILSEATQRKTSITQFHLYVESKIEHKWPYLWNRQNHIQNRLVVAEGRGGWIGSLGLAEASYYIFNAKIWSYYIAQGTIYMAQQPTLVFLLGESMDREAWQAIVHRVAKSRTWLKWLSRHTYIFYKGGHLGRVTKMLTVIMGMLSHFSRVWLSVSPWTVAHQAPLSMGFSRQEYWSGLPFPPPGNLPDPGIKPMPPALAGFPGDSAGKNLPVV